MKQLFRICVCIWVVVPKSIPAQQPSLVLQRFYVIHRLQKICSSSLFLQSDTLSLQKLQEVLPLLRHPYVRHAITDSITHNSLQPIKHLWRLMCTYHFLDDPLFVQEFSRSLYIIFYEAFPGSDLHGYYKANHSLDDDAIAYRFYCIKRLRYAVDYCKDSFGDDDPSTKIMLAWWQEYTSYKHITDPFYTRGLCVLLLMLLDHSNRETDFTHDTHEQLLERIDQRTDQLILAKNPSLFAYLTRSFRSLLFS